MKSDDRLLRCFSAVFPSLSPEDIPIADVDRVAEWDSLATVKLVGVLEEEYGIQIDLPDLQEFVSFEAVQRYLGKRTAGL